MTRIDLPNLPVNLDAERFVLGSILLNDEQYGDVAASLTAADFSLEKHRRIFSRMVDLYERGESIDRVTIAEELMRNGQLESIDGLSYLVSLDQGLPQIANLDSYVRIVKEKTVLRETMFACQSILDRCSLASDSSSEILETAAGILEQVRSKGGPSKNNWRTAGEILEQDVDSVLFPSTGSAGIKTPWGALTEMTGGWTPGDLIVVAGRPSMGKSVIALQQAYTAASLGMGVAYISLEMSKESLVRRLVASISDAERRELVVAALQRFERQETSDLRPIATAGGIRNGALLSYGGLSEDLRPYVVGRSKNERVRHAAILIAQFTRAAELQTAPGDREKPLSSYEGKGANAKTFPLRWSRSA